MKKLFLPLIAFILLGMNAMAQSTANYAFTYSNTGSLEDLTVGATTLLTGNNDAGATAVTPIGFDFYFMGIPYSHFSGNANGQLRLHTSAGATAIATTSVSTYSASTVTFAPFAGDNEVNDGLRYKVLGTAPNRKFVFEWTQFYVNFINITNAGNMQLWLYEATGEIDYVYGEIYNSSSSSQSRSVFLSSGNLANQSIYVTIGSTPTINATATAPVTNTIAAGTGTTTASPLIANIGSSAQGSRWVYTFTPPPAPAAPTALSFSGVGSSGMTLNWTNNGVGAVGTAIYVSTDNITYTLLTTTSPAATSYVASNLSASTTYYFRLNAFSEGAASSSLNGSQATIAPLNIVSAPAGGLWSSSATWVGGIVPGIADVVTIADGSTVTLDGTFACSSLTVGQGSSGILEYQAATLASLSVTNNLTIAAGGTFTAGTGSLATHVLNIGGSASNAVSANMVNNGTLDLNTTAGVTTTFFGSQDATISGSGSTTDFYAIIVNKGTSQTGATLDVTSAITINAPAASANRLTITAGTFKLSSASVLTPYFGAATICAANGMLWLNHSSASIACVGVGTATGAGAPTVTGELRIDNGSFAYGSGSQTFTFTSGSGVLRMSGGTLTMYGAISFPSSTGTQFIMSGGTINVDPIAAANLSTGTSTFSIGASTGVTWSGGTITIVDPHSASGGTAWAASSGGTKTVTGGTLNIGDGLSSTTGGTLATTSGFGLTSSMGIWNLVIDNRTDAFTSRMARLTGTVNVLNDLTVNSNGYLFLGSGTTAATLNLAGQLINNGTLAGTQPAAAQVLGTLVFNGTAAQTVSGSGMFINNSTVSNSNLAGVTFATSNMWRVNRVNMFSGTVTPGSNFTIGNSSSAASEVPIIQYGSGVATTAAGTFTTFPTIDETDGPRSLFYSISSNTYVMGFNNELGTGNQNITQLLVNNSNGLNIPNDRTINVTGTLTMTVGNIDLSGTTLTLGTAATSTALAGTLTYTAGFIQNGTFKRWFPTTGLPTTAGSGIGNFPMGTAGDSRRMQIFFSAAAALSTGGTIAVTHTPANGFNANATPYLDGADNIETYSNATWSVAVGTNPGEVPVLNGANTINMTVTGVGLAAITDLTKLHLINSTTGPASGTHAAATGTALAPVVSRTGLTLTDLTNTFRIGSTNAAIGISAVTSGNWGDGATWSSGVVPALTSDVLIPNGITVTTGGAALNEGNNLVLAGKLVVSGVQLDLGPAGGSNRSITVNTGGELEVSAGTLNINGNLNIAGGTLTQTGGNINIDPNDGVAAASSSAAPTFNYTGGFVNATAGTITLVDPPYSSTTLESVTMSVASASQANGVFSGTHTFIFGDGVSVTAGPATIGYEIDGFVSSARIAVNHIIVNSGNAAGRFVRNTSSTANGTYIKGNLTINSGSEFRWITGATGDNSVGGNIVNNGTLISETTFAMGVPADNATLYTPSASQTISGTGSFVNSTTSPTGSFVGLTAQNSGGTITLDGPFSLTGTLTNAANTTISIPTATTISAKSTVANNGTITGPGTLAMEGTSSQTASGIGTVNNWTINNTSGVTISSGASNSVSVTGVLTSTAGSLTTNGNLTMKSSAAGTARIAPVLGSISGNVTVERYIPLGKRAYRQLAPGVTTTTSIRANWQEGGLTTAGLGMPITGSTIGANGFDATQTGNVSMFTYISGATSFTPIPNTDATTLSALQGYRVFINGDRNADLTVPLTTAGPGTPNISMNSATTLRATGTLVTGPVTYNTILGNNALEYSLIANPYWSPVDFDGLARTNLEPTYWVWDPSIGNRGAYVNYNITTGTSNLSSAVTKDIQPGQAIFVQTSAPSPSIVFTEANKSASANTAVFRLASQSPSKLYINLFENGLLAANGTSQDGVLAAFRDDFTMAAGAEDAEKFTNTDENIAILNGTNTMATDGRPTVTTNDTVPLRIWKLYDANNYTLRFTAMDFDGNVNGYVYDKLLSQQHPLNMAAATNVPFSFSLNDSATYYERFIIVFNQVTPLQENGITIKASRRENAVAVDWSITKESAVREYHVERSGDGRSFTAISNLAASANNGGSVAYHYTDQAPLSGKGYYRIKAVNKDNSTVYSSVAAVGAGTGGKMEASIYPNPIQNHSFTLQLTNGQGGTVSLVLYNAAGQQVYRRSLQTESGNSTTQVDLPATVATGMYMLVAGMENGERITLPVKIN